MKIIIIILFTAILNACGSAENTTSTVLATEDNTTAINEKQMAVSKAKQNKIKLEYTAHARGNFKKIILNDKTVSIQKTYNGKPQVSTCSEKNWNTLMAMVAEKDLATITTLEAPSKAHQYDGAPLASFTITKNGKNYDVPVFDGGNPNEAIAPLVNMVIDIATKTQ